MKKLAGYFFQGLLYIAPLAVTVYVIVLSFTWIDGLLRDLVIFTDGPFSGFNFPGLGLLVLVLLLTLIGFLGQRLITTPISSFFDALLRRAPLVKIIYTSVKELLSAFVGKERKFEQPVLVSLDEAGIVKRIGFLTAAHLADLGVEGGSIAVYMPSSYGLLGELVIVPASHVKPLDLNSTDVMKFVISGGVTEVGHKLPISS